MSYYEIEAEQNKYFRFFNRTIFFTPSHFHNAIELLFVEKGEQEVIIDGEKVNPVLYLKEKLYEDD